MSLWLRSVLVWRKLVAEMMEQVCWSLGECLKMGVYIREQELEISPLMIMRDNPLRDAPETFNAVGIWLRDVAYSATIPWKHLVGQFGYLFDMLVEEVLGPFRRIAFSPIRPHRGNLGRFSNEVDGSYQLVCVNHKAGQIL